MDRIIVSPGQIPRDVDILQGQKNAYVGLGGLAQAMLGTADSVYGLTVSAAGSGLAVAIAPGQYYSVQTVDGAAYGSLGTDSAQTVKQGLLRTAISNMPLPSLGLTSGQSVQVLVEASFSAADGGAQVLPYFNAANPLQAFAGPNNSNTAQNTYRGDGIAFQFKVGTPGTTPSTPSVDSGCVAIAIVTVAYGATSLTSSNIVNLLAQRAGSFATTVPSMAALRMVSGSIYRTLYAQGRNTFSDGGQGYFFWNSSYSGADDDLMHIIPTGWVGAGCWQRYLFPGSSITPQMAGAAGDGSTNDYTALMAALNTGLEVDLGNGITYACNTALALTSNMRMKGLMSTILFSGVSSGPCVTITIGPSGVKTHVILEGIQFQGQASSYTAGKHGLLLEAPYLEIEFCTFTNFDQGVLGGANFYIATFTGCVSKGNNYGLYFDLSTSANAGENIKWVGGRLNQNNINGHTKWVELILDKVSIDYPNGCHWDDNQTDNGGVPSGYLKFIECHIETSTLVTPTTTPLFSFTGRTDFCHCDFLDTSGAGVLFFNHLSSSAQTYLDGCAIRLADDGNYLSNGVGLFMVRNDRSAHYNNPVRISAACSRVVDNDFASGALLSSPGAGWNKAALGAATIVAGGPLGDTYCCQLTSNSGSNDDVQSDAIPIGTSTYIIVSAMKWKQTGAGTAYMKLIFYDMAGNVLNTVNGIGYTSADSAWVCVYSTAVPPRGCVYMRIQLEIDSDASNPSIKWGRIYAGLF